MAKNEFLPFAMAEGANVLSNEEYTRLKTRSSGFQAGVARSQELNKVWRQSSMIAHVMAQFMADNSGRDILDDGDITKLNAALTDALLNKIAANVPAAKLKKQGIVQLSSATDSDSETLAATPKAVKSLYDLLSKVSIDGMYPVGIVVWFAQNKDPNTLFPGSAWKYIGQNRTVRLASTNGSDVMTMGGSDSITLGVGNIPEHSHTFSVKTSSFDYGSKETTGFDYGWKQTDVQGEHSHEIKAAGSQGAGKAFLSAPNNIAAQSTENAGNHQHNVWIGSHNHDVKLGAHTHSVSGTTASTGSGTEISVTNAFIKLMGWYRSA